MSLLAHVLFKWCPIIVLVDARTHQLMKTQAKCSQLLTVCVNLKFTNLDLLLILNVKINCQHCAGMQPGPLSSTWPIHQGNNF